MNSLVRIETDGSIIIHEQAMFLTDYLRQLRIPELEYVVLVYDYILSPYRRSPLEERKRLAAGKIYGKSDAAVEKRQYVAEAIEEFRGCIFNIDYYTREMYREKIVKLDQQILEEDDPDEINKIDKAISNLQKRFDFLNAKIETEEIQKSLKGDKKTTWIEEWKAKQFSKNIADYSKNKLKEI